MASRRPGRASSVMVACALGAIAVTTWLFTTSGRSARPRRVRIGVDQAAPYQSWSPGRGPVGFSISVLREAARQSNIELHWEFHPEGPKQVFAGHAVDLWPLWATKAAALSGIYTINFKFDGGRVRFEINLAAADEQKLTVQLQAG